MSKIKYNKAGQLVSRKGEFYESVGSSYTTPQSVHKNPMYKDSIFAALEGDVDELMNKPRRFFDHLLSILEYQREHDPKINVGNHKEYWNNLIAGAEMWLSAVNHGLFLEVIRLSDPKTKEGKELKADYKDQWFPDDDTWEVEL